MPYCMKCGSPMKDSEMFCALCGTPANDTSSSSTPQNSNNSNSAELSNKSIDELKSLARAGNVDAAFTVGKYYSTDNENYVEADKWFSLTYEGNKIHIQGLLVSLKIKRLLLVTEIALSNGFSGYSIERFNEIIKPYTTPAKLICKLWQDDNKIFDAENYYDALAFLSEINLYTGRILMSGKDVDSKEKAKSYFSVCSTDEHLDEKKKLVAYLGHSALDMVLDKSKSSATGKAYINYDYFLKHKELLSSGLNIAEEHIVSMFGFLVNNYLDTDVSGSFLPYIKTETYRNNLAKIEDDTNQQRKTENSLLYQLDMCANGLYQFEQNNQRLNELKGKLFKSGAVKNEIAQLEAENSQIVDKIAPFLNTYIPKDYWLSSYLSRMRDFVQGGHVSTLQEALSLIRMEEQADHERYMDMVMRAETWRRTRGN